MLLYSNPKIKDFALNMIKYTYFANGLGYGAKSFSNLIPVKFYTDDYQLKNNIVDSRGNTFNQFLQQSLFSEKFEAGQSKFAKRFYDQFYRNFAPKEGFVRSVKIKKQAITEQQVLPLNEQEQDRLETLTAYESKEGAVLTSNGNLVINRRKNTDLVTKHNYGLPVEYIKVFRKTRYSEFGNKIPDPYKVDIYKLNLDSITKGLQNPNDFEGKKGLDTWTYTPISNLGLEGISLEFNFTEDIADTALALAPKIEKKSAANHIKDSQMSEAEAIALMQAEEAGNTTVPIASQVISPSSKTTETTETKEEKKLPPGISKIDAAATNNAAKEASNSYNRYIEVLNTLDESKRKSNFITEDEFNKLNSEEQETALQQIKKC